jgi:hypothetical protein
VGEVGEIGAAVGEVGEIGAAVGEVGEIGAGVGEIGAGVGEIGQYPSDAQLSGHILPRFTSFPDCVWKSQGGSLLN